MRLRRGSSPLATKRASARSFAGLVGLRLLLGVCEVRAATVTAVAARGAARAPTDVRRRSSATRQAGFLPFYTYSVSTYYGERNIGFALSMINSIQLFLSIFSGPFGALVLYLSRDGGARVDVDGRLYDRVRDAHSAKLYEGWGRFWR